MLTVQAVVKKASPLIGKHVDEIDFAQEVGLILVAVELKKGVAHTLKDTLLKPGSLLVFSASKTA